MSSRPNILIVDNSLDVTGALKSILLFTEFAKHRFHFIFVLPTGSKATAHVSHLGYSVNEIPFVEINRSIKNLVLYLPYLILNAIRLGNIIKRLRVKLVHVNDFYNLTAVAAKVFGANFSLLTHVRFMPDRFPKILVKTWIKLNLTYSDRVICVSHAVKNCLPNNNKILVIYDSIDNVSVQGLKAVKRDDGIYLLYIAHFIPGKGQDFAIEAFGRAYKKEHNLRLIFVGGGMGLKKNRHYREKLERRSVELGIQNVVKFEGPTEDTEGKLASADLALNFSESESFSRTCLEALIRGIPLIATDCGGPVELFENGKSGLLIPNRNVDAMEKSILLLARDSGLRNQFVTNSIDYVSRKFSLKNTSFLLESLYLKILPCRQIPKGCK